MTTPATLARARDLVQPALRKAVAGLDPLLRTVVGYQFGWCEADGTPTDGSGGKGIRPALVVLGAEAAGADAHVAVPGAVAVELIHNFSLIHDDIMDGDRTRRHRRTVWDVYGVADAIIIGDALHTLAIQVMLDHAPAVPVEATNRLVRATSAMIAGQVQDLSLDRRDDVTVAECREMEANKTGALLSQSVAIGAVMAGAGADAVASLERYGTEVGLAFQAIDDVLGIWGDPGVTGKPAGNDLRERKKSLPVALALDAGGDLAEEIRRAFSSEVTDDVVATLARDLAEAGIREQALDAATGHLDAALAALESASLDPVAVGELTELARFVTTREF